ncbi:hypothetical protein GQ43DRAFT_182643 [Delitschia confertaspora ATCC 74209]|uniref:Uncharacterized protein n=1 Tax=Delitschia confertaspora ATCC 74209 TaxID=1513339 RepID=A0A9P4JRB4_9PLEO|nr:hypothetical protein GQ43DRAFT_182643 [Delitschia confertaspora ATCC 74209]
MGGAVRGPVAELLIDFVRGLRLTAMSNLTERKQASSRGLVYRACLLQHARSTRTEPPRSEVTREQFVLTRIWMWIEVRWKAIGLTSLLCAACLRLNPSYF